MIISVLKGWKTTHFWGPVANWYPNIFISFNRHLKGSSGVRCLRRLLQGSWNYISADARSFIPVTSITPVASGTMCLYSALFMRFAWAVIYFLFKLCKLKVILWLTNFNVQVNPRNYLLFSCHAFNECAQLNQLRRVTSKSTLEFCSWSLKSIATYRKVHSA